MMEPLHGRSWRFELGAFGEVKGVGGGWWNGENEVASASLGVVWSFKKISVWGHNLVHYW